MLNESLKNIVGKMEKRFQSGNSIPVERTLITKEEYIKLKNAAYTIFHSQKNYEKKNSIKMKENIDEVKENYHNNEHICIKKEQWESIKYFLKDI